MPGGLRRQSRDEIARVIAREVVRDRKVITKIDAEVFPCCHEEHAWWVVSGGYFLSTFPTREEAEAEVARLRFPGSGSV